MSEKNAPGKILCTLRRNLLKKSPVATTRFCPGENPAGQKFAEICAKFLGCFFDEKNRKKREL